jgi:hypothetical protein
MLDNATGTAECITCGRTATWTTRRGRYEQTLCVTAKRRDYLRRALRKYGLAEIQVLALEQQSAGHCDICGSHRDLVIDHDHVRGHVRGLICDPCNVMLGRANDNIDTLANAIAYLAKAAV